MQVNDELQRTLEAEGFVTVARAAELLKGVRRASIYRWVGYGDVKIRRVGRRMFVRKADVERMLSLQGAE